MPLSDLSSTTALLIRTPVALDALLRDLPDDWVRTPEGPGRWSAYDILGHLIHGDRTDWIPRARIILEHGEARAFEPFDREAQARWPQDVPLAARLDEFAAVRRASLTALAALRLAPAQLARRGQHPVLGTVTLSELLGTWVVHDLNHLAQIARVLAKARGDEVGPWREYLPLLSR
ncbi:MAG TPA: DinB family protein [Planctomycetota bacterium]|nr:DinB family protein [Planctomycetota bacterium]